MSVSAFQPTPKELVGEIEPYIRNKKVIDLGCGDGVFMNEMEKVAQQVDGVEIDPQFAGSESKSFADAELKDYDVIFASQSLVGNEMIKELIKEQDWHGTVIMTYPELNIYEI